MRLTAPVALRALRWLEERSKQENPCLIPLWPLVRRMGRALIQADSSPFVAILAHRVGGGISHDPIYSYFSLSRRVPDGEFALRFLALVSQLHGFTLHPPFAPELRYHPARRAIASAFLLLRRSGIKRGERLGREYKLRSNVPDRRTRKTLSDILRHWAKG